MPNDQASANLGTYLNDHLAGSAAGTRLAARLAQSLRDSDPELLELADEIRRDREALAEFMDRLAVERSQVKQALARVVELGSRAKTSRPLVRARELGTLLELEALVLGIEGKLRMWESLWLVARADPRISESEVAELARRAQDQIDLVEQVRLRFAALAFVGERVVS